MSPPFLPAPFGVLICLRPAAVRLPLVTVPEGQQLPLFVVLERCNAESVFYLVSIRDLQRLPPFVSSWDIANARYCFRTLAYNREPFHTCFLSFLDFPSTSTAPVRPDRLAKGSQEGSFTLSVPACYRVH